MKKVLLVVIPLVVIAVLIAAHSAQSFGPKSRHQGNMMREFMLFKLDRMAEELNLDAAQRAKLDLLKQDLERHFGQKMEQRKSVREAIKQELSKDNPDFRKVSPLIDKQIDDAAQFGHEMVNRIGEFYDGLTPEQKKLVSENVLERIEERGFHD